MYICSQFTLAWDNTLTANSLTPHYKPVNYTLQPYTYEKKTYLGRSAPAHIPDFLYLDAYRYVSVNAGPAVHHWGHFMLLLYGPGICRFQGHR